MDRRKRHLESVKKSQQESVELMNEYMKDMSSTDIRAFIQLAEDMANNNRSFDEAIEKTVIAMDSTYVINEHNVRAVAHNANQKDGRNTQAREEQQVANTITMAFETLKRHGVFRK